MELARPSSHLSTPASPRRCWAGDGFCCDGPFGRRHRQSQELLWPTNLYKVDAQVAAVDPHMGRRASKSSWSFPDEPGPRRPAGYEISVTAETVSNLCHQGHLAEAVEALGVLVQTDCCVSSSVFITIVKKCAVKKDLVLGRLVHAFTVKTGHESDTFLCNHILRMYASHGRLQDAMDVFELIARPDAFTWSAIISAHVRHGQDKQAIQLYDRMRRTSVKPDGHVFVAALQACARGSDLKTGQQVHTDVLACGGEPDLFVSSCLVDMYAKCGSLQDAQRVFDALSKKDLVTWTALIAGYSKEGMGQEALRLYSAMQEEGMVVPDSVTFLCLLQACASVGTPGLEMGKRLHLQIEKHGHQADVFVASSLVNMYVKCGSLEDAQRVFDGLGQKDVVAWNAMIAGYSQHGLGQEALRLYSAMLVEGLSVPDSVTFVCLLQACASVGNLALETGKQLHKEIRERGDKADLFVASSLVNMYSKCGSLEDAQRVFDRLAQKDVVTWNAMIAGYSELGMAQEALMLYGAMQEEGMVPPDSVTFKCLLQACAKLGTPALGEGKQLHTHIREQGLQADVFVANTLVNMYSKCGSLEDARKVFDELTQKTVVTWNSMIAGYSQQVMGQEALCLYRSMQEDGMVVPDAVTFACLLQACASVGIAALETGKQIHGQIDDGGHQDDVFVASSLVNMYSKCGSLQDAQSVFDVLGRKDVVTWNSMIAGYSREGMGQRALNLYSAMQEEGMVLPDSMTFVSLLQACASVGSPALAKGKLLHAQIRKQELQADLFVASSLVNMYSKCDSLEDAQRVFDGLGQKNVVTWTALIAGYSQQGMGQKALRLYSDMQEEGVSVPNRVTFVCLLQACAIVGTQALEKGTQLHAQIREGGHQADVYVASSLVNMYAKCGSLEYARTVFDGVDKKNVVVWNAMIAGYSNLGLGQEALCLYSAMQEKGLVVPDSTTFLSLLQACASVGTSAFELGQQLHDQIRERGLQADVFIASSLVNMYAKCGSLKDAQSVFEGIGHKDVVMWNAMMGGYCQQGMGHEALGLFTAMQKKDGTASPDSVTFVCLLQACASLGKPALETGKQIHAQIKERIHQADLFISNSLVNMFAKCGSIEDARRVFDELGQKDVVTWNAMIAGYSQQGMGQEALSLYSAMQAEGRAVPDSVTYVCLLQACASLGTLALDTGKELHVQIRARGHQADLFMVNSLVNMYAKCGSLEDAHNVFDSLSQKDVVTWNALIAGYSQQGMLQEALCLYSTMQEGIAAPNSVTFVCLLQACANVAALHLGRQLHAQIEEQGLHADVLVAGCLINMYGKSGSMVDAQQVFDALPEKDVVTWSALIAGYTCQGKNEVVFDLVERMREDGIQPVGITFLSVLTVCSHAGLVSKGRQYFEAMSRQDSITPTVEHYTCMVDLLGRAGYLDEALVLVTTMPMLPNAAIWHTLLCACQKWSNVEVGCHAFNQAVDVDKKDAAAYVLMSNIYTSAQMWEQAHEMQMRRVRIKAWKQPGQSWWTGMDGLVHSFSVVDRKHPKSESAARRKIDGFDTGREIIDDK